MRESSTTATTRLVLFALAALADDDGRAAALTTELARAVNASEQRVASSLEVLAAVGLVVPDADDPFVYWLKLT
jgi:hypothetical protein